HRLADRPLGAGEVDDHARFHALAALMADADDADAVRTPAQDLVLAAGFQPRNGAADLGRPDIEHRDEAGARPCGTVSEPAHMPLPAVFLPRAATSSARRAA